MLMNIHVYGVHNALSISDNVTLTMDAVLYLRVVEPYKVSVNCLVSMCVKGAGRSSEVERSLMVRWVIGSILHGVDPLSYFSFQPVLHDWCNKDRGMCYPVWDVHIKEPLLLRVAYVAAAGFLSDYQNGP